MVSTFDGDLNLSKGLKAAQELVRQRLRFKKGEWFLNRTAGRIDLTTISHDLWHTVIADTIRGVDCVTAVSNVKVARVTDKLVRVTASVETTEGAFKLSDEIEP